MSETSTECNHQCFNKQLCGHKCCNSGLTSRKRPPKTPVVSTKPKNDTMNKHKPGQIDNYMYQLKDKVSNIPQTPNSIKRPRLQVK